MVDSAELSPFEKMVVRRVNKLERQLGYRHKQKEWVKHMQQKLDGLIPEKIHHSLALALEKGVKGFLQGLNLLEVRKADTNKQEPISLETLAEEARHIVSRYKKIALVEGAGTGVGGIVTSAVDFPLLLSIKLKLLQELAQLFGYSLHSFKERIYILRILQFQFSEGEYKQKGWAELKHWTSRSEVYAQQRWSDFDWDSFYMEYKQSIELRKLLQMIPGLGAIVGAWANHSFIDELGRMATLCLLWRKIQERYPEADINTSTRKGE